MVRHPRSQILSAKYRPVADARYWCSIVLASICGTACGDWLAGDAGLGLLQGLCIFAALLALLDLARRFARVRGIALYWAAIVLTRGAATNLADLATHRLHLGYAGVLAALAVALLTLLRLRRPAPVTFDTRYWCAILLASTLGTALGDGIADGIGLGVWGGSAGMTLVLCAIIGVGSRSVLGYGAAYWLAIVAVRSDGTMLSDGVSHLPWVGHAACAAVAALLLSLSLVRRRQGARLANLAGAARMSASGPQ